MLKFSKVKHQFIIGLLQELTQPLPTFAIFTYTLKSCSF